MTLAAFAGMTKEQFLGKPRIVEPTFSKLFDLKLAGDFEPFLAGKYRAKFSADGANVFDGDKIIAAYKQGAALHVMPDYRGQGIHAELIFQLCERTGLPPPSTTRSEAIQRACGEVYDRIQGELSRG